MKNLKLFAASWILFLFTMAAIAQQGNVYQDAGYTSLFNGKDLTGWVIPEGDNGHWSVIDQVIDYDARSEAPGSKDLWTEKEFQDFVMHVEWRFKGYGDHLFPIPIILPDGNYVLDENGRIYEPLGNNSDSGILFKGAGQANLWCWAVGSGELWSVRNDDKLSPEARAAAVPSENADKAVGEWNAFDIIIRGDRITLVNNGVTVIHNALFPGLDVKGPIGLQHHGGINQETGKLQGGSSLVQFRNIWIKEL